MLPQSNTARDIPQVLPGDPTVHTDDGTHRADALPPAAVKRKTCKANAFPAKSAAAIKLASLAFAGSAAKAANSDRPGSMTNKWLEAMVFAAKYAVI